MRINLSQVERGCQGVLSGYADNTFRPANNTTRAQIAKMIVLAEGFPVDPNPVQYFADVPLSHPFAAFIATAFTRSLIASYTCGGAGEPYDPLQRPYFRPGGNVTRAQLTKIIVGAEGWVLTNPPTPTFRDVPLDSPFYPYIETASARGLVSGYTCGGAGEPCPGQYFRPSAPAVRGQIAKIIYNAITAP